MHLRVLCARPGSGPRSTTHPGHAPRRPRSVLALTVLVALGGLAALGCGGDEGPGTGRFRKDGFAITFEQPPGLRRHDRPIEHNNEGLERQVITWLRANKDSGIFLLKSTHTHPINASNLDHEQPKIDQDLLSYIKSPTPPHGQRTTLAGYPALRYPPFAADEQWLAEVGGPDHVTIRFTALFDGRDQYAITCYWTPARRAQITAACHRVLKTIARA